MGLRCLARLEKEASAAVSLSHHALAAPAARGTAQQWSSTCGSRPCTAPLALGAQHAVRACWCLDKAQMAAGNRHIGRTLVLGLPELWACGSGMRQRD